MHPLTDGLAVVFLQPAALLALLVGTVVGVVVGLTPGLSSRSAMLIAIPFLLSLDPIVAAILLISLHAASQISGTVPAALFGVPTSASEAASVVDGYPLAVRGEGSRVFGAIITSSAFGGLFGAIVLLLIGPFASSLVLHIGSPEITALAASGLIAIAAVSSSGLAAGVALGAAGILVSTVGIHAASGIPRFVFGQDQLYSGVSAPALIAGVMAVPELLRVESPVGSQPIIAGSYPAIFAGALEPFKHLGLLLRSSIIGLVIGVTPGVGSSVAAWLSYAQATRTVVPVVRFGEGAIEGVIAPETGSGSKEGGALIPTLFLGVPGSSGMAILLSAFAIIGISVGPGMFSHHPEFPATVAYTVAGAEIIGLLLCLAAAPVMMRLAALPREQVAIVALVGATLAAYYASPSAWSLFEILIFAASGVGLAKAGLARPPFLIGFVIGPIFESALLRSAQIYSWTALLRPGVLLIAVAVLAAIGYIVWSSRKARTAIVPKLQSDAVMPLAALAVAFFVALCIAHGYPPTAAFVPKVVATTGLIAAIFASVSLIKVKRGSTSGYRLNSGVAALFVAGTGLAAVLGPIPVGLPLLWLITPLLRRLRRTHQGRHER